MKIFIILKIILFGYIISIILGGSIYLLNDQIALTNNGLVFSSNGFTINLILLLIITPFILYKYIQYQKSFKNNYSNYYDVDIYYKDEKSQKLVFRYR